MQKSVKSDKSYAKVESGKTWTNRWSGRTVRTNYKFKKKKLKIVFLLVKSYCSSKA